jgi:hypothetical protein
MITGLEDAASWYEASVTSAQALLDEPFRLAVQKAVWHLLDKAGQVARDAEWIALRYTASAEKKASRSGRFMAIHDFVSQVFCEFDPDAQCLADDLAAALDGTVRTSSACENVNSILRAYLWGRRAFKNRRTAQNWLNLLILFYNLHIFQRGKRKGDSPFDLAGVVVHAPDGQPTTD